MTIAFLQSRASAWRAAGDRPRRLGIARPLGRSAMPMLLLMLLALAGTAGADTGTTIIERCTHGQSISGFSQQAYRRALAELPTEVEEYSDCANLIRRAQLQATGRGGGSGPGRNGALPIATPLSPRERTALAKAQKSGTAPLRIGSRLVQPGIVHTNVASAFSTLPDPLLAILAFLLACAAALGGRAIRNGVRARRTD
jgi:hypothetical protein